MTRLLERVAGAGAEMNRVPALIQYGNFLFKYRNAVFPLVLIVLLVAFHSSIIGDGAATNHWLDIIGVVIVFFGQSLRATVIGLAYIKRGGVNKRIYADNLVTEGIFAHCRNPLYVGNLLILLGVLVIYNNPWVYLLGGGFFLMSYTAIVVAEEAFLHGKFGSAYESYCRDVNRWWIAPRGLAGTFSGMRFNWRRVIIKDYTTITTSTLLVLALIGDQMIVSHGFEASRASISALGAAALAMFLAMLVVRALKKSNILTDRPPELGTPSA